MSAPLDWLSRLLVMMPVSGQLEIRCSYGAPRRIAYDRANAGEMPYHVCLARRPYWRFRAMVRHNISRR